MTGMSQGDLIAEADKNRRYPDLGQALMVAWTVRANPGISKKEILRMFWCPRPGQWDGIREVLQTSMVYRQKGVGGRGWYPTDRLVRAISRLETHLGVQLPTMEGHCDG